MARPFDLVGATDDLFLQRQPKYAVVRSAAASAVQAFPATGISLSQANFVATPPSASSVVDRRVVVSLQLQAAFSVQNAAIGAGQPLALPGRDFALIRSPLAAMCSSAQVQLNNQTFASQPQLVRSELQDLGDADSDRSWRLGASKRPMLASHNDALGTNMAVVAGAASADSESTLPWGAFISDFAWVNPNTNAVLSGAGSYVVGAVTVSFANGVPVASAVSAGGAAMPLAFKCTIREPVACSPLVYWNSVAPSESGLWGITALNITLNFAANAGPAQLLQFCPAAAASTFSAASITNVLSATAYLRYATPKATVSVPRRCIVPSWTYVLGQSTTAGPLAPNGTLAITTQSINLSQMPSRIIIVTRPAALAGQGVDAADFRLPPVSVQNLQVGDSAGLCAGWTIDRFFDTAKRAGYAGSFPEYAGQMIVAPTAAWPTGAMPSYGGFICVRPGVDVALGPDAVTIGSAGPFTVQCTYTVANPTAWTLSSVQTTLIAVFDGYCVVEDGTATAITVSLSGDEVLGAQDGSLPVSRIAGPLLGGALGAGMASIAGKLGSWLRNAAEVVKPAIEVGKAIRGGVLSGAALAGAGVPAGGAGRGRDVEKASLRDLLRDR